MKAALFDEGIIAKEFRGDKFTREFIDEIFTQQGEIDGAIVVSTAGDFAAEEEYLRGRVGRLLRLDHTTPIPINNMYITPETLGKDRLAAAVGAWAHFRGDEILIVDFGTAITIDLVSAAGEFLGGNISPGAAIRFKALNEFTAALPLGALPEDSCFFGKQTAEAVGAGVANGIKFEIEGYIRLLKENNDDLVVIFTGGDAIFFAKQLNYPIFVHSNIVLEGLNTILEYNAD